MLLCITNRLDGTPVPAEVGGTYCESTTNALNTAPAFQSEKSLIESRVVIQEKDT